MCSGKPKPKHVIFPHVDRKFRILLRNLTLLFVFGKTRPEKNGAVVWDEFFLGEEPLFLTILVHNYFHQNLV